jgi:8-oxo-dGTP pyrophosphatase MutT (NUDIX family)
MANEAFFHVGIKAIILNEKNEILLLRAGPETLRREIEEELNVPGNDVEIGELFDASVSKFKISHEKDFNLFLVTFLCKLKGNHDFKLSDEHEEHIWTSIDDAKKKLAIKFADSFLEKLDELK